MDSISDTFLVDTHAHLDMIKEMSPEEAVTRSAKKGVRFILNIGSSIEGSEKSVAFSKKFDNVFASVGVHPHDAKDFDDDRLRYLESLVCQDNEDKIVAIGETGFDLYRNLSPVDKQEEAFKFHIELALKHDLPLMIHNRDADDMTLSVLKQYIDKGIRGVVHCFSGDLDFANRCMKLGLFISFTGVITYPKTTRLEEVVKKIPIDRMFVETDCPFLSPQNLRGKENYPGNVYFVAERVAEIKGISLDEVAKKTSDNAIKFFGLD